MSRWQIFVESRSSLSEAVKSLVRRELVLFQRIVLFDSEALGHVVRKVLPLILGV